jgi:hypothetical protein
VLVKNVLKGFSPARMEKPLVSLSWGKAKRPAVAKASNAMHFLKHKSEVVPRAMMVVTIAPHPDDLECEEMLPVLRIPVGKGKGASAVLKLIMGCSKHVYEICLKERHLAEVHDVTIRCNIHLGRTRNSFCPLEFTDNSCVNKHNTGS